MGKGTTEAQIHIVQNIVNQIGSTENQYLIVLKIITQHSNRQIVSPNLPTQI